jgi:hypothetical protein
LSFFSLESNFAEVGECGILDKEEVKEDEFEFVFVFDDLDFNAGTVGFKMFIGLNGSG